LRSDLDGALRKEQHEALIARAKVVDTEAEQAKDELEAACRAFDEAAHRLGQQVLESKRRIISKQDEFHALLEQFVPGFRSLQHNWVDESGEKEAAVKEVMLEIASSGAMLKVITYPHWTHRPGNTVIDDYHAYKPLALDYTEAINLALRIATKLEAERQPELARAQSGTVTGRALPAISSGATERV